MKKKIFRFVIPLALLLIISLGVMGAVFAYEIFGSDTNNLSSPDASGEPAHTHSLHSGNNTVREPYIGYCGNTITKVGQKPTDEQYIHPILYEFWGDNSVKATDILRRLDYKAEDVCDCDAEFMIETEIGKYEISINGAYARVLNNDEITGQVSLTGEQVAFFENIVNDYFKNLE